jgi:hypothetical protein
MTALPDCAKALRGILAPGRILTEEFDVASQYG